MSGSWLECIRGCACDLGRCAVRYALDGDVEGVLCAWNFHGALDLVSLMVGVLTPILTYPVWYGDPSLITYVNQVVWWQFLDHIRGLFLKAQ